MKQSHSMSMTHSFDGLLDVNDDEEMQDQLKSNFITFLRMERMNNRTLDFKKVINAVEPLAYSHALIVLNKKELVTKLLSFARPSKEVAEAGCTTGVVIQGKVVDLLIALIKDLRQDIYQEFIEEIMPTVISIINVQSLQLLDHVFTLFSFSFKYLLKPIRDDIQNFYTIYQELLVH